MQGDSHKQLHGGLSTDHDAPSWPILNDLIGRAYFWIGSLLLIFPIAAYFPSRGIKRDLLGLWRTEDYIWLISPERSCCCGLPFLNGISNGSCHSNCCERSGRVLRGSGTGVGTPFISALVARRDSRVEAAGSPSGFRAAGGSHHCAQESAEPIHVDIVYNYLDAEAKAYAAQFGRSSCPCVLPVRLFRSPISLAVLRAWS